MGSGPVSRFRSWFEAQFGPRPHRELSEIRTELASLRRRLAEVEAELLRAEGYYAREDAALKAWLASETWEKK